MNKLTFRKIIWITLFLLSVSIVISQSFSALFSCIKKEGGSCILWYFPGSLEKFEEIKYDNKNYKIYIKEGITLWCTASDVCRFSLELYLKRISVISSEIILSKKEFTLRSGDYSDFFLSGEIDELKLKPGKYRIYLRVLDEKGSVLRNLEGSIIEVREIPLVKIVDVKRKEDFFGRRIKIVVKNFGNAKYVGNIEFNLTSLESLFFSSATGKYEKVKDTIIFKNVEINPGEEVEFTIYVSYIPIYILPVIIAVLLLLYLVRACKVFLEREIIKVEEKDGYLFVKVLIRIFNNKETMKDVRIVETFLKDFYEIIEVFPRNGILNKKEGKIVWVIDEISVGESILLTYTLKVKKTLEKVRVVLGPTKVTYNTLMGQTKTLELDKSEHIL